MGKTTVAAIVYETCTAIWYELVNVHMPKPSADDLKKIADEFYRLWQFPNCIGAIDGKHCRIKCPAHSGSSYYNYKKFFSVVLQAVADANRKFIAVEVGGRGKQSDGGTFHYSVLNKLLENGNLKIPPPAIIPGTTHSLPYVFVGDEAYPLRKHLMRPFPRKILNDERKCFNRRLSRARNSVECAFGILYSKWRFLGRPIETNVGKACLLIKTACLLHNIIRDLEGGDNGNISLDSNITAISSRPTRSKRNNSSTKMARNIRNSFVNYFWQNKIVQQIE